MEERRRGFPWCGLWAAVSIVAGSWGNFGLFLVGGSPHWLNTALSLGYLLFWCAYPFLFPDPRGRTLFLAAGLGTGTAAALALPLVLHTVLSSTWTLLCLLLALPFAVPLSGLCAFLPHDYVILWGALLILGIVWTLTGLFLKFGRK